MHFCLSRPLAAGAPNLQQNPPHRRVAKESIVPKKAIFAYGLFRFP